MKNYTAGFLAALVIVSCACYAVSKSTTAPSPDGVTHVAVTFSGGFDTDPRDRGRPVVLIAAALNVPADVFRETFTHVTPAGAGHQPEPDQIRKNKAALMKGLSPYGVTNDRLDTVSNYYRYNRSRGETWTHAPAEAYATVRDGVVTSFVITRPGAGYSSAPTLSLEGLPGLTPVATLFFGTDLAQNGSVQSITITNPPNPPSSGGK